MDRGEVAGVVVVPGNDVVDAIGSVSTADVADSSVTSEHFFA